MSILGSNGKNASAGPLSLYHLTSGQIFYSESAKEEGDSFIFDGEKTAVIIMSGQKGAQANFSVFKAIDSGFKPRKIRVLKTSIAMISDSSEPNIEKSVSAALAGLVMPGAN